jgi:hypothetical protein
MSSKPTDIRVTAAQVHFLPVTMRVPLKFGPETVTNAVCLRVRVEVTDRRGNRAEGWGETPLSVSWVWPSTLGVAERCQRMEQFSVRLARRLVDSGLEGHPMEIGHDFIHGPLAATLATANAEAGGPEMPYLGSLVAFSAFDIAVHDAYGRLLNRDTYSTYTGEFMNRDLAAFLEPDSAGVDFAGRYPADYLVAEAPKRLPVWHLVGGVDAFWVWRDVVEDLGPWFERHQQYSESSSPTLWSVAAMIGRRNRFSSSSAPRSLPPCRSLTITDAVQFCSRLIR